MKKYHHHSCPSCGQPTSWSRRILKCWIHAHWDCSSCGAKLKFSVLRRLIGVIFFILFMIAIQYAEVPIWFKIISIIPIAYLFFQIDGITIEKK